MSRTILFEAKQLRCVREQRELFADISFMLASGEALFIEGANGVGKSSLLRLLAGIATPFQGSIYWQNESIQANNLSFKEQLHYIGHCNGIKLGLTVLENLQLTAHLANKTSSIPCYDKVLQLFQMHHHTHHLAKNLSAGQRRRIALAKLFLFKKKIWILDEPLTALDIKTQQLFLSQMEQHLDEGGIVIASSHQPIHIKQQATLLRLPTC